MKALVVWTAALGLLLVPGISGAASVATKEDSSFANNNNKSTVSSPAFLPQARKLRSAPSSQLQVLCEKIAAYEKLCGSQTPSSCGADDTDVVDDYVESCFNSYTISSGDCIERINQDYAAQFAQEKVPLCASTLSEAFQVPATATTVLAPAGPKLQVVQQEATVCAYSAEQSRLICTVSQQCGGDVAGESLLKCWDRGTLTLNSGEVNRYQTIAGNRTPRQMIEQDACLQNYCTSGTR